MPSNHEIVARSIRVFIDQTLSDDAIRRRFATLARQKRDELISSGIATSRQYDTYVDNVHNLVEESVRIGGAIEYVFNTLTTVIEWCLAQLRSRSPVLTGDYADAWTVGLATGPWIGDFADIPPSEDVFLVNPAPYSRRLEVGRKGARMISRIIDGVRLGAARQFPGYRFRREFVTLPPSFSTSRFKVPYILNFRGRRRIRKSMRSRAVMTYPCLVITREF